MSLHFSKFSFPFCLSSSIKLSTFLKALSSTLDAENTLSASNAEFNCSISKYVFFILVKYSFIVFSTIA